MKAQDIYEAVTATIVEAIETGLADPDSWVKPWSGGNGVSFNQRNATTGKRYQGFNTIALICASIDKHYSESEWATYKQWEANGRQVVKGEKATHLVKWVTTPCKPAHPQGVFCNQCGGGFPVGFAVFNLCQLDDYVPTVAPIRTDGEVFDAVDAVVAAAERDGVKVRNVDQDSAYYERDFDLITLPALSQFKDAQGYYATILHELSHASGHTKRLDREYGKRFGDNKYAMEELTAELAAAFLGASFGVCDERGQVQHGSYLANWLRVLKEDSKALAHIASRAQAAADYWEKKAATSRAMEVAA